MKRGLLVLLFICILTTLVSATECYQETANVATECGGLDTGSYAFIGITNQANTYDGNWSTFGSMSGPGDFMYINYTIPQYTTSVIWVTNNGGLDTNRTILQSCLDYDGTTLQLEWSRQGGGPGVTYYRCYDGAWQTLATDGVLTIYEEALYWNIEIPPSPIEEVGQEFNNAFLIFAVIMIPIILALIGMILFKMFTDPLTTTLSQLKEYATVIGFISIIVMTFVAILWLFVEVLV